MLSVLFAVAISSVTSSSSLNQSYADAYAESVEDAKPLMVVVGAPWCPACKVLKSHTIEPMADSGELRDISVAVINRDDQPELVDQLTEGDEMLPQIIMFSPKPEGGWKRRKLLGFQPKQPVRSLIQRAKGG